MFDDVIKKYHLAEIAEKCDSISSKATITDFIHKIREKNAEVMPVVDDDGKVVGIVTEKDLIKLIKTGGIASNYPIIEKSLPKELLSQPITAIMTPEPLMMKETDSLEGVMNLILNHDFRRVIITSSDGRLIGKIRIADIIYRLSK